MISKESVIVVTGAAGFIGSCMVGYLNEQEFENLILVDEFDEDEKELNLHGKKYLVRVERENFFEWLNIEKPDVKFMFHLGARTDTTEFDYAIHQHLNVDYSQKIWNYCTKYNIPLVYASSAATYGSGEFGYIDDHEIIEKLQPLNPYGISKNEFDKWVLKQSRLLSGQPSFWAGLKFFNVYGPNEYHKARMASMIFHGFHQIKQDGFVKLFKSYKEGFKDGEQLRDFIYVKDVIKMCYWFMQSSQQPTVNDQKEFLNGIYNIGTGKARSFNDLINAVYAALDVTSNIQYVDMPSDLRDTYQYFTEAEMQKIKNAGYDFPLKTLEEGVTDYVKNYLATNQYY
ncbi:MAG: ADP-glyceromanno-heptose 6-epimerase [Chitinophagaceae bacterium]